MLYHREKCIFRQAKPNQLILTSSLIFLFFARDELFTSLSSNNNIAQTNSKPHILGTSVCCAATITSQFERVHRSVRTPPNIYPRSSIANRIVRQNARAPNKNRNTTIVSLFYCCSAFDPRELWWTLRIRYAHCVHRRAKRPNSSLISAGLSALNVFVAYGIGFLFGWQWVEIFPQFMDIIC